MGHRRRTPRRRRSWTRKTSTLSDGMGWLANEVLASRSFNSDVEALATPFFCLIGYAGLRFGTKFLP
jgi:hypothetical protein